MDIAQLEVHLGAADAQVPQLPEQLDAGALLEVAAQFRGVVADAEGAGQGAAVDTGGPRRVGGGGGHGRGGACGCGLARRPVGPAAARSWWVMRGSPFGFGCARTQAPLRGRWRCAARCEAAVCGRRPLGRFRRRGCGVARAVSRWRRSGADRSGSAAGHTSTSGRVRDISRRVEELHRVASGQRGAHRVHLAARVRAVAESLRNPDRRSGRVSTAALVRGSIGSVAERSYRREATLSARAQRTETFPSWRTASSLTTYLSVIPCIAPRDLIGAIGTPAMQSMGRRRGVA